MAKGSTRKEVEAMPLPPAKDDLGRSDEAVDQARAIQAIGLKIAGKTYDEIARQLEYSDRSGPHALVKRALARNEAESVAELRTLENARLDTAQAALWPRVLRGEPRAVDSFLRLSARRSRLNGMDAPIQVAVSAGLQVELDEALELIRELLGIEDHDTVPGEVESSSTEELP